MFLDGGELERLIEAEGGGWSGRIGEPRAQAPSRRPARNHVAIRPLPLSSVSPRGTRR